MTGFYNPVWLLLLLAVPVICWLCLQASRKRKAQAMEFSRISAVRSALGDGKPSRRPQILFCITVIALSLIIIGLADPHIPLEQTKEGVNLVLVMDVSGSMEATDYKPTRLESAKHAAELLLNQLDPKDYSGVVLFESGATSAAYLSPDRERVISKLRAIKPKTGRTAIGDGLTLGIDMAASIPNRKKVVVLLSDGVNNAGVITPEEAAQFAADEGIQVFTIGLGSKEPALVGYDWTGNPQYAVLDEQTLISIADKTGGRYFMSVDDGTLSEIYSNLNQEIKREKEETSIRDFFFASAIILLIAGIWLRYGRGRIIQ